MIVRNLMFDLNVLFIKRAFMLITKMRLLHWAQKILTKCDLFSTSQFLRYQEQPEYKTASGGICSLLVVGVFIGLFMSIALQTINLEIINWTATSQTAFNPLPTDISVDPKNSKFMFAVNIMGIDLNDPTQRFFDIYLVERHFLREMELANKTIPMVQCTQQHFNVNDQISKIYTSLSASRWLCPPLGYNFTLEGKFTSQSMKTVQVYLGKCHNSTEPSRSCVSDATVSQYMAMMGQFYFSFIYVNPLINAGDSNYLRYQLDDRNFIRFTTQLGTMSNGFVKDYSIITDISLLPYSQNIQDNGVVIQDLFQNVAYQVTDDNYATFFLMKASSSVIYQRSFNKIDSFFSYVGGLVGTILGFMLVVKAFTEMSFELNLSQKLFKYKDGDPNDFSSFNLLTYCRFVLYLLLKFLGKCKDWKQMIKYDECKEEMVKQLDIQLLIHKIYFLQRAIEVLFEENQLYCLHLQQFDSLIKLKRRRKHYAMRKKVSSQQISNNDQIHQTQSDNKSQSDDSEQYSETEKPVENNTSINYTMDMRNGMLNSNIDALIIDNIKDLPSLSKRKEKTKKKSRREQLQRLQQEMEDGNHISKKIFQGIDPIYLEGFSKGESPQMIADNKIGDNFEMVQVHRKQDEVASRQKIDFEYISD